MCPETGSIPINMNMVYFHSNLGCVTVEEACVDLVVTRFYAFVSTCLPASETAIIALIVAEE